MLRKSSFAWVTVLLTAATMAPAQQKKRVAVMNFDYATVQSNVAAIFNTNQDIGKGISDMLVDRLVSSGAYSVIERKALDKIMAEQNFSNSDRADANSAAKLGRLLGANVIIVGSITQFGRDDKSVGVGGGAFGGFGSKYGLGGVGKKNAKAVVVLTARLVNVDTGEILASASGKGESKRSGMNLLGAGGGNGGGGGGDVNMNSSNFANTIIGEAVNEAVNDLSAKLVQDAGTLPTQVVTIDGLVADASGGQLVLNVGKNKGVKVGDKLEVRHTGRVITDPATGKVLRRMDSPIGTVTITDVDDTSSVGTFSGSTPAKTGDRVKSPE
ncbi:MAG TPA: CsgG/HfaB family protein [Bryobacteraceae bacterium]|nr:CsgG/HfaB family protein [Bryobacteraceae bacterium]